MVFESDKINIFVKKSIMKYLGIIALVFLLASCGAKVAYTDQIKEDFNLYTEAHMKKVQFYISQTIVLQRVKQTGGQGTTSDGALVTNSNREENRITIQAQTPGIFESYGKNNEMLIRFEVGQGRYLSFKVRQANNSNAKYYLEATWDMNKGGELMYGNEKYTVESYAGNAYLMVMLKKLQKTKRQDRVVKGLKV